MTEIEAKLGKTAAASGLVSGADTATASGSFSKGKVSLGLAALIYLLYLVVIFQPLLTNNLLLAYEDGRVQNYPAFASLEQQWTPNLLCGFPVLADPQVATFYPIMQLCRHLFWGFNLYQLSPLLLAMLGTFLFLRRLTGSNFGALLAGICFGGSGFFISELNHVQILHAGMHLPFLLYFVLRLNRDKEPRIRLLSALALSLLTATCVFAGHPQTAVYVLLFTAAFASFCSPWESSLARLAAPFYFLFCGALLALPQILPSFELNGFSGRPFFRLEDFQVGQGSLTDFVGFVFPYLMGGRYGTLGSLTEVGQGPAPGYIYLGIAPLFLSLTIAVKRIRQPLICFFLLAVCLTFSIALLAASPFSILVYQLPLVGHFRGQFRILLLTVFALSVLVACAIARVEQLARRPGGDGRPFDLFDFWRGRGLKKHFKVMLYLVAGGLSTNFLLSTLALFYYLRSPLRLSNRLVLLLAAALAIMIYGVTAEWRQYSAPLAGCQAPAGTDELRKELQEGGFRVFPLKGLEGENREYPPNLSRLWQVPSASGYEPLMPWTYARLMGIAEGGFMKPPWYLKPENRAFDVASVKYVTVPKVEVPPQIVSGNTHWQVKKEDGGILYFENKRVLPRARLVPNAIVLDTNDCLKSIRTSLLPDGSSYRPLRHVLFSEVTVEQAVEIRRLNELGSSSLDLGSIKQLQDRETELLFQIEARRPAFFVLSDQYYPGWKAYLDNRPVEIIRANAAFRAVIVPEGRHSLAMKFESDSLKNGFALACLGLLLLLLGLARIRGSGIRRHDL